MLKMNASVKEVPACHHLSYGTIIAIYLGPQQLSPPILVVSVQSLRPSACHGAVTAMDAKHSTVQCPVVLQQHHRNVDNRRRLPIQNNSSARGG